MKKVLIFVLCLALLAGVVQVSTAQGAKTKASQKQGEKPGGVVVKAITEKATVAAIDASKRTVSLKFANGVTQTYKLDKAVKNFDEIKVGDKVSATYFESVAVFVRKSTENPAAAEVQTVTVAPKGAKPGVYVTDTFEVTAKVEAIDYKMRAVVLKGPEGNMRIFAVDKSAKGFKNVKVGDEVVLRVTEAMAIAVEKP